MLKMAVLILVIALTFLPAAHASQIVNDVTQINPIAVDRVLTPHAITEISAAIKNHPGPVSIGGGRFSMGGQTASEGSLHLDMREFDDVVAFSPADKTITVEAGITWRKIQERIDPHDLSLKIMQSYANFTVGGSLSVNAHGRYMGLGPLIMSVKSLKVVLADGSVVVASPTENAEIFYGVIGGYGGLGVIAEATLDLADNRKLERRTRQMAASDYKDFFFKRIKNDKTAVFHNADLYPPDYDTARSVTWHETDKDVTVPDRLRPAGGDDWLQPILITLFSEMPFGYEFRSQIYDPIAYAFSKVVWRNYEASYDVHELEPWSRERSTYVLQEYFVPVGRFDDFVPKMKAVLNKHDVNVVNVSIRHALTDPGSLLAWAKGETFAFVLYYKQGIGEADKKAVGVWTRELIDAALAVGGTYYLPYQIHATDEQFRKAYPRADEYFDLKKKLDPTGKFTNKLWDQYYPGPLALVRRELSQRQNYRRAEEQTYLTLPEWAIVYSSDEYAAHLQNGQPSDFPYYRSLWQFWSLYANMCRLTKERYPVNWQYHTMITVIGTSISAEYIFKSAYESTIGRFTEWASGGGETAEDQFLKNSEKQYADFTHKRPWYEFPFSQHLKNFWRDTSWWDDHLLRKWERKAFVTAQYGVKAFYGWSLGLATHSAYAPQDEVISLLLKNTPDDILAQDSRIKIEKRFDGGFTLITIPRYEPFREILTKLANQDAGIVEIAGNRDILFTVLAPSDWPGVLARGEVLFESTLVTDPDTKRAAVRVPVDAVKSVLGELAQGGASVEHVYDY